MEDHRTTRATGRASERRLGRPPVASHAELERIAIRLFTTRGFEATSVDDIAAEAGVSRRTFFRYFAAKPDVVWGDFDAAIAAFRADLGAIPPDVPLMEGLGRAVVRFNRVPPELLDHHRQRMRLILEVPELIARSTLWYAKWRHAVVDFAADRLGQDAEALLPRTIGYCALGAAIAAYEQWLRDDVADLERLLERAFRALAVGFDSSVADQALTPGSAR